MSSSPQPPGRSRSLSQLRQKPRGSSRFKGVTLHRHSGKWMARAMVRGERLSLGYHDTEEEAAMAYDRAVYARVPGALGNFPIGEYPELGERRQVCMPSRAAQEVHGMTQARLQPAPDPVVGDKKPPTPRNRTKTDREAKQPYRYDICGRGHDMRDMENVRVGSNGYQECRTCINDRQRSARAKKRAARLRREARLAARRKKQDEKAERLSRRALEIIDRKHSNSLGRQGDADRMLEVVGLRRDLSVLQTSVQLLKAGMKAGDELVGRLRTTNAKLMGDNANLRVKGRLHAAALVAAGALAGAVLAFAWCGTAAG